MKKLTGPPVRRSWSMPAEARSTAIRTHFDSQAGMEQVLAMGVEEPGLVDTYSTPTLLELVRIQHVDASRLVTHHFPIADMEAARLGRRRRR